MAAPSAPGLNPAPASGPPRIAICVLPLANLGGDPEQQYFSDGITADIITELSRCGRLPCDRARPRSSIAAPASIPRRSRVN